MPIVDVRPVVSTSHKLPAQTAQSLADSLADVLNSKTGQVWVRVTELEAGKYAENDSTLKDNALPVFVEVLHANLPEGDARRKEAEAFAEAVAVVLGRPVERVHIEYAPSGRGRLAFGGKLVE